jgi:hypothetical protein
VSRRNVHTLGRKQVTMPTAPRFASTRLRLPLVTAIVLGALSCTDKTRATKVRALTNIERIAAWEKGKRAFRRMPPRPAGTPWNQPVAAADVNWFPTTQDELQLEPDSDGKFRVQYEVRLDPVGELATVVAKPGPNMEWIPEVQQRVPMWCEVFARGRFRSAPEVVELFLRLQRSLQNEISQTEVAERPVAP